MNNKKIVVKIPNYQFISIVIEKCPKKIFFWGIFSTNGFIY